ncbi:hypothetical protein ACJJIG_17200 [Microbulbifer sp. SSSA007]|uniref:hypothetical protein n=1 Tax=Microbulbifer sp. SSSA007 TaxID=3243379 RepID=UPI0040396150
MSEIQSVTSVEALRSIETRDELLKEIGLVSSEVKAGSDLDVICAKLIALKLKFDSNPDLIDELIIKVEESAAGHSSDLLSQMREMAKEKKQAFSDLRPLLEFTLETLEWLRRTQLDRKNLYVAKRGVDTAETGVEAAKEGVRVAAESTKAAKKSATAAEASAEIARTGAVHTRWGVWVAAGSALIAALALCYQIYSQNNAVSVNLNSPVDLQPITLSDDSINSLTRSIAVVLTKTKGEIVTLSPESIEDLRVVSDKSIYNLTHAISVEIAKAKGGQVTLSPESIEDLRAVLRLELESSARIGVVETKEEVEQKAN